MQDKSDPYLGTKSLNNGICGRTVEGGLCNTPATLHIIWTGRVHSYSCDEHGKELETKRFEQVHPVGKYCSDPRSMWYPEEKTCKIPMNEAEMAIGIFLID